MLNSKPTQANRVLHWLKNYETLTQLEAWRELGVMRLASRIDELRKAGHKIESKRVDVYNRWDEKCSIVAYSLANEQ